MLYLKHGVSLITLQPQMAVAMVIADQVYGEFAIKHCVVTSANDSTHMPNSLHYKGWAIDLRTKTAGIEHETAESIGAQIRQRLGFEFDVIVEGDHIHIEFDPKKKPAAGLV